MILVAIDPGKSGALAYWKDERAYVVDCPNSVGGMLKLFKEVVRLTPEDDYLLVRLERVHGYPGWGATNFAFGENYGMWKGIIQSQEKVAFWGTINPKSWQKLMDVKGETTKERSWRFAVKNFPECGDDLGDKVPNKSSRQSNRADALCILYSMIKEALDADSCNI